MNIKPLDKRGMNGLESSYSKMIKIVKQNIEYYVFAMKVKKIESPIITKRDEKNITILDNDYIYIQILPINKNYSLTMTYDNNGNFIEWYFDITSSNFLDERGMPFYEDMYLDIVLTKAKKTYILDKEELDEALQRKEITSEQYNFAIREAELVKLKLLENFEFLQDIAIKYYKLFFKPNISESNKKINTNTFRVNIKPGIKVAIVLKKDQKTGVLTEGVVKDILTNSAIHHRGIKVRLTDGQVGRVQKILE